MSIKSGILTLCRGGNEYSLDEIAAFQICHREITGDDLYELNVVLIAPNTRRINIATSPNKQGIQENAQNLSQFVGKPLFDHSKGPEE